MLTAPPTCASGCADGTREGFLNYPDIAGCLGAWTVPGLWPFSTAASACSQVAIHNSAQPACNRQAGNNGSLSSGQDCNVADLCSAGWHVCDTAAEVGTALNSQNAAFCSAAALAGTSGMLAFLSRASGSGSAQCNRDTGSAYANDAYGCGNYGSDVPTGGCSTLSKLFSTGDFSASNNTFYCPAANDQCEAMTLINTNRETGGVMCCRDSNGPCGTNTRESGHSHVS